MTLGERGSEQFEFLEYVDANNVVSPDAARLYLSRDNCALAIVDGQHRAMALLALHRNLTGGWTDKRRSPYERYYTVWPEKEIRSWDLEKLQMPMIICTFPQLNREWTGDTDVIRAARRVFLTLNKTAKKVSESRNRLLNDQDMVAECLRETLSYIKQLDDKDDTALRIWNIELDQEGDRVRVNTDVAFSGVSHLYQITEHILMSADFVTGTESRGKVGAPRKNLSEAYERLGLKDAFRQDIREANTRTNYSDEMAKAFRTRWAATFLPVIDRMFAGFAPLAAFAKATLWLKAELQGRYEPELETILFDGQATARTFDDFREGLKRRYKEKEDGWSSPAINETLNRAEGLVRKRGELLGEMAAKRAMHLLQAIPKTAMKKLAPEGTLPRTLREVLDQIYESVFETVAFQTALVCTFTEAIERTEINEPVDRARELQQYLDALHKSFQPKSQADVQRLIQVFEGKYEIELARLIPGGATFRSIVLPGELQPAEWPKFRYVLLELWTPCSQELNKLVQGDLAKCRVMVAKGLLTRRVRAYCDQHAVEPEHLTKAVADKLMKEAKRDMETFLQQLRGTATTLDEKFFEGALTLTMEA
jgi:hypothetical protein